MLTKKGRRARPLAVLSIALSASLTLASCSDDDTDSGDDAQASQASTPTETSPSVEAGMTTPGTDLSLGERATVRFQPNAQHGSAISLGVTKVTKGKIKDLSQFTLDKQATNSSVYYVNAVVKNTGRGNLSGQSLSLYGLVGDDLIVPRVVFGSTFNRCNYQPLPEKFTQGKQTNVCMVMLAPKKGKINEVQWRAPDNSDPISWTLS